jgi:hypothetical protein
MGYYADIDYFFPIMYLVMGRFGCLMWIVVQHGQEEKGANGSNSYTTDLSNQ